MKEYIEREALAMKVRRYLMPNVDADGTVQVEDAERYFLKLLEDAPAADVQEVRHGRWERTSVDGLWECSLCHEEIVVDAYGDIHPLYDCGWIGCPRCLAKMDGKGDA